MTRTVVYSPRARQQLTDLYRRIAEQSGLSDRAVGYVSAILDYCGGLAEFPLVGAAGDDLRPGLRTIGFRRRVVIAFTVTSQKVEVLGVYYGGRDYETLLRDDPD